MSFIEMIIVFLKKLFGVKEQKQDWETPVVVSDGNSQIDTPEWIVENQVRDAKNNCLKVIYKEKYGIEIITNCMVLFRNDTTKQYKMVAPWMKGKIVEMSNITGIEVYEVSKNEVGV
jgi:hypothetical protein